MEPAEYQRFGITSAEVAYLTSGSWHGIAKGFAMDGYYHDCDDAHAIGIVADYFLGLSIRCVTAEVMYKCCGSKSVISYAVLDESLLVNVLTTPRK